MYPPKPKVAVSEVTMDVLQEQLGGPSTATYGSLARDSSPYY